MRKVLTMLPLTDTDNWFELDCKEEPTNAEFKQKHPVPLIYKDSNALKVFIKLVCRNKPDHKVLYAVYTNDGDPLNNLGLLSMTEIYIGERYKSYILESFFILYDEYDTSNLYLMLSEKVSTVNGVIINRICSDVYHNSITDVLNKSIQLMEPDTVVDVHIKLNKDKRFDIMKNDIVIGQMVLGPDNLIKTIVIVNYKENPDAVITFNSYLVNYIGMRFIDKLIHEFMENIYRKEEKYDTIRFS